LFRTSATAHILFLSCRILFYFRRIIKTCDCVTFLISCCLLLRRVSYSEGVFSHIYVFFGIIADRRPFCTVFYKQPPPLLYLLLRCQLIFYTLPQNKKSAHTSSRGLFSRPTHFSWISSVPDVSKLPLFLAMPKPWCCVGTAISCCANQPAAKLVSQRDAPIERR
jgi:hypothetical protein